MAKIKGQLEDAQLQNKSSDPTLGVDGKVWLNTTSSKAKIDIGSAAHEIVTHDQTQTLTNKTIDGDDNTVQDLALTSLKTVLADASKFIARDGSGVVVSVNTVPSGTVVGTSDTQTLTNKSLSDSTTYIVDEGDSTKRLQFQVSGISTATTRTLTAPNFDGTIATVSGTETLTNKSLSDSTTYIVDDGDNTKKAQFQASGITTGTTRTFTFPDANTTLVGTDTTQTLSGKTMQGPDGSNSAPTYSFSGDTDTGIYRVGSDDVSIVAGTYTGVEVKKSTGNFANVGMGSAPSSSDQYPLLISRSTTSAGTHAQIANPSTSANAKAAWQIASDNGNITFEMAGYTAAATVDAYISAGVLRSSGSAVKTSLCGPYVTTYAGGVTSAEEVMRFNADKSVQLMQEISTPATPSAGVKIYTKSDKKIYKLDTLGNETEVGSGGSSGINYMSAQADAETSASLWVEYDDANSGVPVNLIDGTVGDLMQRSTTNPLRGSASFLFTPGTQGEGAAFTITPNRADILNGSVMEISFDYEVGTANIAEGDYQIWVYDVANSALIQPTPYKLPSGVSGAAYKWKGVFQLPTNGTTFRIALHIAGASVTGTIKSDNWYCGPQVKSYGPYISDTATLSGCTLSNTGNGTVSARYQQIGDVYRVWGIITIGSSLPTGSITLNLPFSIDTTKQADIGGTAKASAGGNVHIGTVEVSSATAIIFYGDDGTGVWNATVPVTWANGNTLEFEFIAPVVGKSSSMLLSSDADTRVVAGSAYRASSSQTGVNPNNSAVKVQLNSIASSGGHGFDTHGCWDVSTNYRYTVSVPGYYNINACIDLSGTNVLNNNYWAVIYRNGSAAAFGEVARPPVSTTFTATVNATFNAVAGDYFELYLFGSGNNSASTLTIQNSASSTFMDIFRLSGPSQIAATETIMAAYTTTAGNSLTNNTDMYVDFGTKVTDTHGIAVRTGVGNNATSGSAMGFVVPSAGRYVVTGATEFAMATTTAYQCRAYITRNGTEISGGMRVNATSTASTSISVNASTIVDCVAGDLIQFAVWQSSTADRAISTNAGRNRFSICRIGI